jgi:predicted RNA polymerase sigma factor
MHRENEITEILTRVDQWSQEDRVALAYQILREMRIKVLSDPPRYTLERALGIGRGDGPAPTDDEIDAMMAQHRLEKYR